MDCVFNLAIPKSTKEHVIIRPSGKTFITGIASSYSMTYPKEFLSGILSETDYQNVISDINESIMSFWPCCYCFSFGYGCALCTLGLSFIAPYICISDAKDYLLARVQHWNRTYLAQKGITLSIKFACSTSWVRPKTEPRFIALLRCRQVGRKLHRASESH